MATAIRSGNTVAEAFPPSAPTRHAGYLFHPVIDFLLAGGGSILVAFPVYLLIRDKQAVEATALWWGFALSNVINFPHFAHSYQLLYTGIGARIAATSTLKVRLRYVWAGCAAPLIIGAILFGAYYVGDVRTLSYAANVMAFTSGWHYVKQGYGVSAVLRHSTDLLLRNREAAVAAERICRLDLLVDGQRIAARPWPRRRPTTRPSRGCSVS